MIGDRDRAADGLDEEQALRALWAAVIWRALLDIEGRQLNTGGDRKRRDVMAREARAWLGTRDFAEVCGLIGLNPVAVRQRVEAGCVDIDSAFTPRPVGADRTTYLRRRRARLEARQ